MERGAWWAAVHRVTRSRTQQRDRAHTQEKMCTVNATCQVHSLQGDGESSEQCQVWECQVHSPSLGMESGQQPSWLTLSKPQFTHL